MKPALLLRRLDLPGLSLRCTRRESRRRAKLREKRPLQNSAGRLLNLCHRHQTPQPSSRKNTSSRARRKTNCPNCNQRHRFGYAQCPDCHSYAASKSPAGAKMTAPKTPAARRAYKKIAGQSSETAARSNGATGERPGATVRQASKHRGVEGYRLDCSASPAAENAQRRLDRDRRELANAIHRQAAPTAIGRRRSRRWMSSVGHRCR